MSSGFLASVHVIKFHTVEELSSLALARVKYNINELSRGETAQATDLS